MKKIYKFLAVLMVSLCGLSTATAQNDGISLTLLPHSTYNNFYNPAISIDAKYVLGLGISNVGLALHNTSIKYENLYKFENNVPIAIDANKFINSLKEHNNLIGTHFSLDMLRLGLRFNKLFVDFNWRFRLSGEVHYSKDFLGFFVHGNGHYLGHDNPADFSIGADMTLFSEFALGLQYDVTDKLTVGVRPKLLCGIANSIINDDNTLIYTDPDTYEMVGDISINAKASTILNANINRISEVADYFDLDSIPIQDIFNIKENLGFGIDFGASYTFNDHIGVAVGVYDLGYITWRNSKEKHIKKDNVVINNALIDDIDAIIDMNLDVEDLYEDLVDDVWENDSLYAGQDYKTSLKTRIVMQAYYELMPMVRFTAMTQMYYTKEQLYPSLTLAYSGSFMRIFNLTANLTMSKYTGNSVGAGVAVNLGLLSIYATTDNIMILSKLNAPTSEVLTSFNAANFRLGLIFKLGRVEK